MIAFVRHELGYDELIGFNCAPWYTDGFFWLRDSCDTEN